MSDDGGLPYYLGRLALSVALVFGTYNPSAYSYVSWVFSEEHQFGPITAVVGLLLLIGWIIFLRATFLSMGWLGVILGTALLASLVWWFVDLGWLALDSPGTITWVVLTMLALILAAGMCWAHIRRRLSGQVSVDDVED